MKNWQSKLRCALVAAALLALSGLAHAAGTGSVDKVSGWYRAGTNLTAAATATDICYVFDHWAGETNGAVIAGNSLTLNNLSGPRVITASFKERVTSSNSIPYTWLREVDPNLVTSEDFETAVTNDPDGDGFTTAQEYWSGTHPNNADSYLHISGLAAAAGNIRLSWEHANVDSRIPPISIQVRTNLQAGAWQVVANFMPVNGTNMWDDAMSGPRYYRLCVTNAP